MRVVMVWIHVSIIVMVTSLIDRINLSVSGLSEIIVLPLQLLLISEEVTLQASVQH